jgi:hypothetical protein
MNALPLAPEIHARLLASDTSIPELALRASLCSADWQQQRAALQAHHVPG